MSRFSRARPPEGARALVGDERPLAWGAAGDALVVATDAALWLGADDRLPWHDVLRAAWDPPVLTVEPVHGEQRVVRLSEEGRLPETVRDRVTASIALSRSEQVGPGTTAQVVARRRHGDQRLHWTLEVTGPAAGDADVQARAEEVLAAARDLLGD